jgi:hypothetical protein
MTVKQLRAAILTFEYRCERCHQRMAKAVFDHSFVCRSCRRVLDHRLLREGKRRDTDQDIAAYRLRVIIRGSLTRGKTAARRSDRGGAAAAGNSVSGELKGASMRIRLVSLVSGGTHEHSGRYLISYDPEFHLPDGTYDGGRLITTPDREQATEFDFQQAVILWRSGPSCSCHRLRADGEPNRPLTAFNVEISRGGEAKQ